MTFARQTLLTLALALPVVACGPDPGVAAKTSPAISTDFGILLMAHGGAPEWNEGVLAAVEPLENTTKIEVAFGMADAVSIQDAVDRLEERGVKKIGVVRLFISGDSWYERTGQILGVKEGAPLRPAMEAGMHGGDHGGHSMEFWRVTSNASFALSTEGLAEAESMGAVLADRAKALSSNPQQEDVLILAHGPADDAENERWISHINARAKAVKDSQPFRRVEVMTLREDWPEKRKAAEQRIRDFVQRAKNESGTAIVVPFRVHGFGPYSEVLEGLEYESSGQGLIPHASVTDWISDQIEAFGGVPFESRID